MNFFKYEINSPKDIFANEWVLFIGIFLLSFAVIYLSLSNFFYKKKEKEKNFENVVRKVFFGEEEEPKKKGPLIVISLSLSLIISFAVTTSDYVYNYILLGSILSILIFSLIVFVILGLPFYKFLETSVGSKFAAVIFFVVFWIVLSLVCMPFLSSLLDKLPSNIKKILDFLSSVIGLILLIVLGFIIGAIRNK
ncbi:MAG: hypothetical protein QW273_03795 [Candidatus Pacearchaeota archaeon]